MSPQRIPAGVIVCLVCLPHLAAAEPPAALGRDRYGDPLPPGVIARLGTQRLTPGHAIFLTFSPDGRRVAAHTGSQSLCVWEVASGREVLRLTTPPFHSYGPGMSPVSFSPDGKSLALACQDHSVRLWEVATGRELHRLGRGPSLLAQIAFAPDGRSLFAGGYDGPVHRHDLAGAGPARAIGDFQSVLFLAVSRDGKTLTAAISDPKDMPTRTFVRWDIASGREQRRHSFATGGNWAGALSPEGSVFAAPAVDGKSIALLDPLTGRECGRAREADYPARIAFSADGQFMTSTSKDGVVRVWEVGTGKLRTRFKALSTGVEGVALSPDGKVVALSGRADHAVHLWDVAAGRELHPFGGHRGGPLEVAFVGDGREVATVSRDSTYVGPVVSEWADWSFRRWDAATGAERAVTSRNPNGEVHLAAFSADGRRLVTVLHDGTLRLWDVEAGKELRTWKVPTVSTRIINGGGKGADLVIKDARPAVSRPAFTPDGKVLLAAGGANVHRWEVETGKELPVLRIVGLGQEHSWCAPSPDGRTLVVWVWGASCSAFLVEADSGKVLHRLEGVRGWPHGAAFAPDGRTVAVEANGAVTLWEVASGRSRGRLTAGGRSVRGLAFSPDGRLLASGGFQVPPVSLWDLASGEVVGRLRGDMEIGPLAFSPEGTRLAVVSSPTVLICDVAALCGKRKLEEVARSPAPSEDRLEELWAELAGADGTRAYRAVLRLGAAGTKGAALLKHRLKGGTAPDATRIARLLADLDSDDFATREKATAALEVLGAQAGPALRRAVENATSAEVRNRAGRLLKRLDAPPEAPPTPELVSLRAVEALEANATAEARVVLAELAAGPAADALTREAKASLQRLARRARAQDAHDGRRSR
jgi:WD40 repeat protein